MSQVLTSYLNRPKIYTPDDAAFYKRYGDWPSSPAVVSLLHFDTDLTDQIGNVWTANGNAAISTAISKFGAGSLLLDGNGDYISTPSSTDFDFGSEDFTVEQWLRTSSSVLYDCVFSRFSLTSAAVGDWKLLLNHGSVGNCGLYAADYSTSAVMLLTAGVTINDGAWHHLAWVRNGTSHKIYVDGTARASGTFSFSMSASSNPLIYGMDRQTGGRFFNGNIDEIRISKGIARWTADFTPPIAAY